MDGNSTAIIDSPTFPAETTKLALKDLLADVEIIFRLVFGVFLCEVVSVCGLVTNAIVMTVFYRQGIMGESSTVSLFALALSDFLVQISHITLGVAEAMKFAEENKFIRTQAIDPMLIKFLGFFEAKIIFGHIICWLTAYLSFERCFSVLFPFKVKLIFSPKNSLIAVSCIYAGALFTFLPLVTRIGVTERIVNNRTITTFYFKDVFGLDLINAAIVLNPLILRSIAIFIVVISNILILIKVNSSKDWRKTNASSSACDSEGKNKNKSSFQKEEKLIKMISMISAIFLFCTAPDTVAVILTETGFCVLGDPTCLAVYGFVFFMESVNSCVNIFVYYFMSSSFNKRFNQLFGLSKADIRQK